MEIAILIFLVLLNGFFALSEIALVSCKRSAIEDAKLKGKKGASKALKLLDNSDDFLSAIQVGITLIGIITGVYGGINIADDFTPFFQQFDSIARYAAEIALTFTIVIITFISIVVGELVPKTLALNNPNTIALAVAPYIYYFSLAFYPFVWLLSASTNIISSIIGVKKSTDLITEAELRQMIKLASNTGVIEKAQNVMHEKVFHFADKKAKHIMTHRIDLEWINANLDQESIHEKLLQTNHSKIIFCNDSLEDIIGILRVHDYFKTCNSGNKFNFNDLLIEPTYVPESISAQSVLSRFQEGKIQLCCVVNEYGGFEGIITIHDIIENFVGQIPDDGQVIEPDVFVRDDDTILVNGDAPIETLSELIPSFQVNFEEIDYATVAGFVVEHLRKIPQLGDKIMLNDFTIEVIDLDGNKIDKVLISKPK